MTNRPSIALFAYPWDVVDRGPAAFLDECRALGITDLHVATIYHTGKFLLPRNRRSRVYFPEPGCLYVPASREFFGEVRPNVSPLASTGWLEGLTGGGLPLSAWTVFHHSSTLGARYPHLTARNLYGDAYPYALCPTHPAVQEYAVALARSMAVMGCFETIDLETIGFLGYYHGFHHEMTAVPVGPLEQFLLSLCFCEACRKEGERRCNDMNQLAADLRRLLDRKLQSDDAAGRHPDNMGELAGLIALMPPLQQLIRQRLEIVSMLVARIRAAIGRTRLAVYTSGFVGAPSNIWMEGVDIEKLRDLVDRFHLLAYAEDPELANADLAQCLFLAKDASRLNLTLSLGLPSTPTLGHAMAKVQYAWKQGIRSFSFYNYGLLGEGRLGWLREIAAKVRRWSEE